MAGFNCHFNTKHLLIMRMMQENNRNLMVDQRKRFLELIDEMLHEHALTGCPCIERTMEVQR